MYTYNPPKIYLEFENSKHIEENIEGKLLSGSPSLMKSILENDEK